MYAIRSYYERLGLIEHLMQGDPRRGQEVAAGMKDEQVHAVPRLLQDFGLAQGDLDGAIGIEVVAKDGDALHSGRRVQSAMSGRMIACFDPKAVTPAS